MKAFGLILCAGIALLLAAYAAEDLQITTRKQSFPEKQLSVERTYRGNQCIVLEMTEGGKRTRVFRVNGKTVLAESDEDNDGFFESFMVFDPKTEDFEWFSRTTNNIVRPVASEQLQEAKAKKKAADKALYDLIEK
jgi:hypothetical protein